MENIFIQKPYQIKNQSTIQNPGIGVFIPSTPLEKIVMQQDDVNNYPDILQTASNWLNIIKNYLGQTANRVGSDLQKIAPTQEQINRSQSPITKTILKSQAPGIQSFIEGGAKQYVETVKNAKTPNPMDLALGFMNPESGMIDDAVKAIAPKIAKEINPEVIKGLLSKIGIEKKLIPTLSKGLVKVTNEEEVINAIKNATGSVKKIISPELETIAQKELGLKERGFSQTVAESEKTAQKIKQETKSYYVPTSNESDLDYAKNLLKTNLDEATKVAYSPEFSAKSNAVREQLILEYQNAGRYQDAINLINNLSEKATTAGQGIQILNMYNKLTPEGILRYAQNIIEKANKGRTNKLKLDNRFVEEIIAQVKRLKTLPEGREKIVETAKLLQKIADKVPSTIGQKISTIQTLSQLLNPKTAIRNLVGNVGFQGLETVKDVPATMLDSALSLITKQRTKSLPNLKSQLGGFKTGIVEGVEDALNRIDTSAIPTKFDLPRTATFKGGVGASLEKLLNIELKATDRAFYKAAYDGSLAEQMIAKKIKIATDTMKEQAHLDALYRTFQDDNVVSKLFTGIKKSLNVGKNFGLGDFVLKYPKTPANLLARGIEYSGGGFINSLMEMAKPLVGKEFNQRKFVETFSRALVGTTGLVGMGALMHRLGIITGRPEKDTDIKGIQRISGLGQYRINVSALKRFVFSGFNTETTKLQNNDTLISYDWFQPMAINLSIGANIDEGNGIGGQVSSVINSISEGINTLAEQPLVSGLTRLLKTQDFSSTIQETLKGMPPSFIPTFLSQITQLIDNTQRNSYDPSIYQYALNLTKQKIPGLAQTLPPSVDAFGDNLERYQGKSNNLFNVFFNPAFISKYKKTPEAQMVLDLMNETGETKQAPRLINYTQKVNGENKKLNPKQITSLQRYVGTITKELFASFASDTNFQNLPPTDKVNYLANVISDIGSAGKIVILGDRPKKPSKRTLKIVQQFNGIK